MEEFERARDLWKKSQLRHLLLYFKTAPSHARTLEELDQMKKVAEFRTTVGSSALVKGFRTVRKFEDAVRTDLAKVIAGWKGKQPQAAEPERRNVIIARDG
jgi:hypothetical protein